MKVQIGQIGLQIGLLLPVLSLHTSYTSYTIYNMQTNWQHQLRKIDLKPENSQQEKPVTLVCSEKRKSGWQDLFLTHVTNPDEWEDTLSQPVLEYWKLGLGAVYFCTVKTFFPVLKFGVGGEGQIEHFFRLLSTHVLTLWGSSHIDYHVWKCVIVPLDLAWSFGMICAHYRYRVIHRAISIVRMWFKSTQERQFTLAWRA